MKSFRKHLKRYLPIIFIPILTACSNGGVSDTENSNDEETTAETEVITSEFADVTKLSEQSEFTTVEFTRLINFLDKREVIITGYPYAYPLGEGEEIEFKPNSTDMLDGIDNSVDNCSISIKFKNEEEPRIMHIGDLFAVKGIMTVSYSLSTDDRWPNTTSIKITDAEFVDNAEETNGTLTSFDDLDLEKQIFCGDLYALMHNHYEALSKKSVVISGNHSGTTVSRGSDDEVLEVRIDLGGSDNKVGCEMADETDAGIARAQGLSGGLKIEGKFSGIVFNNPRISGGVLK
ncbi:MAG: hypothetical protein QNK23_18535 [Crocinitomicaceae bacterium]|nr:hypothetical protein [Crocinitomicaceae bacterium]